MTVLFTCKFWFIYMQIKPIFIWKAFALGLILKQRWKAARKLCSIWYMYFLENQSYTCTRLNYFESWIHVITKQVNNHYDITSRSQATDESWFAKSKCSVWNQLFGRGTFHKVRYIWETISGSHSVKLQLKWPSNWSGPHAFIWVSCIWNPWSNTWTCFGNSSSQTLPWMPEVF